jgi:hypothetical protein
MEKDKWCTLDFFLYVIGYMQFSTPLSVFGPEEVINQRVNVACLFPKW